MAQVTLALKDRQLSCHTLTHHTRIGRDPSNEVTIDNPGVSRHHASIGFNGSSYVVSDEGSQNGLFVNGTQVSEHSLVEGDVIQVGKFSLRFSLENTKPVTERPPQPYSSTNEPRALLKTFALGPEDVKKLIRESTYPPPPPDEYAQQARLETVQAESAGRVWVLGVTGVVLVGLVGYLLLIQ